MAVQARWDVIAPPLSPDCELDGWPALTTGNPIAKRELLLRPRSSVPPIPSGAGRRERVGARVARSPLQVSPGSVADRSENARSAVFSRASLHFRQFLLWNQERGESCTKPPTQGAMTPWQLPRLSPRTDITSVPDCLAHRLMKPQTTCRDRSSGVNGRLVAQVQGLLVVPAHHCRASRAPEGRAGGRASCRWPMAVSVKKIVCSKPKSRTSLGPSVASLPRGLKPVPW